MPLPTDWYFVLTLTDTRSSISSPPAGDPNQNPNPAPGTNSTALGLLHLYQSLSNPNSYGGTIGLWSAPLDLDPVYWPVYVSYNKNGPSPNITIVGRGINTFLQKKMGLNLDSGPTNPPPPPYGLQLVGDWDGNTNIGSSATNGGAWMSGQWLNWAENGDAPPPASSTIPATSTWYDMTLWDARPGKNRYLIVPFLLSSSSLATPNTVNYGVMGLPGLSTPPASWQDNPLWTYWATNVFTANSNASGYQFQVEGPSAYLAAALGISIPGNARFQFWALQVNASAAPQGTATVPAEWLDSTALASLWTTGTPPTISGGPANNNLVWTTAVDGEFADWQ